MQVIKYDNGVPIKAWVDGVEFEDQAKKQLENLSKLPFIYKHIAVMPDVHLGKGSTIGSVVPTINAIIPSSVSVDIGCGMTAALTTLTSHDLPDSLGFVRAEIEKSVPFGRTDNGGKNDRGAWHDIPKDVIEIWNNEFSRDFEKIITKYPDIKKVRTAEHLSTAGSGNHYEEICIDELDRIWILLHTGSRGLGNKIGTHFINLAKKEMERWFINLPDKDLAYLPEGSIYFDDYVEALMFAQRFAKANRKLILSHTLNALSKVLPPFQLLEEVIDCHHNYVEKEFHMGKSIYVTRKGAVRAQLGDMGIIPGSMGAKSFIVKGKGNPESFNSCSHGAGRRMGRKEAERRYTLEDQIKATEGVECRKDAGVIDEIPYAYKDIMQVMAAQADLVDIVHELKQIICVKG